MLLIDDNKVNMTILQEQFKNLQQMINLKQKVKEKKQCNDKLAI